MKVVSCTQNLRYCILLLVFVCTGVSLIAQTETRFTNTGSTTSVVQCGGFLVDDGGEFIPYQDVGDMPITDVLTICPDMPSMQVARVSFHAFDVAPGDLLTAYDGANISAPQFLAESVGSGSGASVSDAPGGGWVQASCENESGCITFAFSRNRDNIKGAGFKAAVECSPRNSTFDCSAIEAFNRGGWHIDVADCGSGTAVVRIPVPEYTLCGDPAILEVSGSCMVGLPSTIVGSGEGFIEAVFPIGDHRVVFTNAPFGDKHCEARIRITNFTMACNDDANVSLSSSCVITLTPDIILEDPCYANNLVRPIDGALVPAFYYEVELSGQSEQQLEIVGYTVEGYPVIDFTNVTCETHYEVLVKRYYVVDSDCDGELFNGYELDDAPIMDECSGSIFIQDKVDPRIENGPSPLGIPCFDNNLIATALHELDPNNEGQGGLLELPFADVSIYVPGYEQLEVKENCFFQISATSWEYVDGECATKNFVTDWRGETFEAATFGEYRRTFEIEDRCGNKGSYDQLIYVIQVDVVEPLGEIGIECNVDIHPLNLYKEWQDWVAEGKPSDDRRRLYSSFLPSYDPTPITIIGGDPITGGSYDAANASGDEIPLELEHSTCGYAITWEDSNQIPSCGGGYKIFRHWTAYNWCEGVLEIKGTVPQVIKVGDIDDPEIIGQLEYHIGGNTAYDECGVSVTFFRPAVQDACSETEVHIEIGDEALRFAANETTLVFDNLPVGEELNVYIRAVDDCGNEGRKIEYITFEDTVEPTAICEQSHTVSLSGECSVVIPATALDDGSYDNCANVTFSVARMDADDDGDGFPEDDDFGRSVTFTGDDLDDCTGSVQVVFRVTDFKGNSNICMSEVILQDKIAPQGRSVSKEIECSADLAEELVQLKIETDNIARLAGFSQLLASGAIGMLNSFDNCSGVADMVTNIVRVNFDDLDESCRNGVITYNFELIDQCNNKSGVYTGTLILRPKNEWEMHFPLDAEIFCNDGSSAIPAPVEIDDILINSGCDFWGLEVDTDQYDAEAGACFKVVYTYKFINWCTWNPNNTEVAILERPEDLILEPNFAVSMRYADENLDGVNDIDDGDEDQDGKYIYTDRGAFDIADANEADAYDIYDLTDLTMDADFVVIDYDDGPYQTIATYTQISQFSGVAETYVSAQSYGNFAYRQIIKINDRTAPTIEVMQDGPFCGGDEATTESDACTAPVDVRFVLADLCSAPETLTATHKVSLFGATATDDLIGVLEYIGEGTYRIQGNYPMQAGGLEAQHTFMVTVTDGCGNEETKEIPFLVKDCKAPTAYCIFGVSATADEDGLVSLWASDFDAGSADHCTATEDLKLTFANPSIYPDSTSRTFSCTVGEVGTVAVELWVEDQAGNTSFCETFVNITPSENPNCRSAGASLLITGSIYTEDDRMVENVEVNLSGNTEGTMMTSNNGAFLFDELASGYDYTISPYKTDASRNGVSTFDLVLMKKHILDIERLDSPYKMIAADINNSGTITTLDVIQVRKLILELTDEWAGGENDWRFIPKDYQFPDPNNPWAENFPQVMSLNDLNDSYRDADFIAVKVGDLNNSVETTSNGINSSEARTYNDPFIIEQTHTAGDGTLTIELASDELADVQGFQFAVEFDPTQYALTDIQTANLEEQHFGTSKLDEGVLLVSWDKSSTATEEELASLVFEQLDAKNTADAIRLTSRYFQAEAYDNNGDMIDIQLAGQAPTGFTLHQNQPNPFRKTTNIAFDIPTAMSATLSIHDLTGKVLYQTTATYEAGMHQVQLSQAELPTQGVFYYSLETAQHKATRKMIRIK